MREAAVRAVLHHLANRGELSLAVAQAAFVNTEPHLLKSSGFRTAVNHALSHGVKREAAELRCRLYWGVVDHLATLNDEKVGAQQAVLDFLDQEASKDAVSGARLRELAQDLQQLLGLGGSTIRELFEKHPGAFGHVLLLFFLRKHMDELIDFDTPGVMMTEADALAAAILYSLREDWMELPAALRNIPGLYAVIAQGMATSLHRLVGTDIDLGDVASYPPLRELFSLRDGRLTASQKNAALQLARAEKWQDAIETRVTLGKGDYRLEIASGNVQIVLPGEVKAVTTEVRTELLLDHIAQQRWPLNPKIDTEVRSALMGK